MRRLFSNLIRGAGRKKKDDLCLKDFDSSGIIREGQISVSCILSFSITGLENMMSSISLYSCEMAGH